MQVSERKIRDYFRILILCFVYALIVRSLEFYWVSSYHIVENLLNLELIGLLTDFFYVNSISILVLLLLIPPGQKYRNAINIFLISLVVLFSILHVLFLKYYVYILKPVGLFLFKYSFRELFFTVSTSEVNFPAVVILVGVMIAVAFIYLRIFRSIRFRPRAALWYAGVVLISLPLSYYSLRKTNRIENEIHRNVVMNKSVYFYGEVLSSLLPGNEEQGPIGQDIQRFQGDFSGKVYFPGEYPLLHKEHYEDEIGNFFTASDTLPNFVLLVVEGLGQRFLDTFHGINLMPFLDSLAEQSLYWDRFFTTAERSFGVLPSMTGSLPHGVNGFTMLDPYPRHISMISLFKRYGYKTDYFDGQGAWFDQKDRFLKANEIDMIFDKSDFSTKYHKVMALNDKFFWGYQDRELLQQSLEVLDSLPSGPRIDLYFTGSMHSPFPVENPEYLREHLENLASASGVSGTDRKYLRKYRKFLISVLFTDRALEEFMRNYAQRTDYGRTIFLITGDHPMTEIPIENSLKRYQVPLIMFSPLLNRSKRMHATGSHLDIYPTLLALMKENYGLAPPAYGTTLGNILDTLEDFSSRSKVAFMDGNRAMIDFYDCGYYLTRGNRIYKVDPELNLITMDDRSRLKEFRKNLEAFKRVNTYVCIRNKLLPDSIYFHDLSFNKICSVHKENIEIPDSNEYTALFPDVNLENGEELYIELSYTLAEAPESFMPTGVVQVNDLSDSMLIWQPFSLPSLTSGSRPVSCRVRTDTRKIKVPSVKLKVYFWNPEGGNVSLKDLKADLYQQISGVK